MTIKLSGNNRLEICYLVHCINRLLNCSRNDRNQYLLAAIESAVTVLEAANNHTYGHSSEVAATALYLSRALGLSKNEQFKIKLAALLHDIGKITPVSHVCGNQDSFNNHEFQLAREHPITGANIISCNPVLKEIANIVLYHHARWDGKGYPEPLAGNNIPLGARIIAIADAFQTITSGLSHRSGMTAASAVIKICQGAGSQFDPEIVEIFLKITYSNPSTGMSVVSDKKVHVCR